ncbi:MAG: DUF4198 domain-containing protein [Pseudomonadota bacterium]
MFRIPFGLLVLLLLSFQQAAAHDAWLQQKDGRLTVAFGHGNKLSAYDPEKVKDAKAVDCTGVIVPVEIVKDKDGASITSKGTPATVTVLFDGGYGVKTTEGWKRVTKREAQGKFSIIEALKSRKYSKALLAQCDTFSKPLGLFFEIVPRKDPFACKPGEALPIKVLLDGKPMEGAVVKTGDAGHSKSSDKPMTDKDGKASVIIAKGGPQLVFASYKRPLKDDPDADVLSLSTSLSFDLK